MHTYISLPTSHSKTFSHITILYCRTAASLVPFGVPPNNIPRSKLVSQKFSTPKVRNRSRNLVSDISRFLQKHVNLHTALCNILSSTTDLQNLLKYLIFSIIQKDCNGFETVCIRRKYANRWFYGVFLTSEKLTIILYCKCHGCRLSWDLILSYLDTNIY